MGAKGACTCTATLGQIFRTELELRQENNTGQHDNHLNALLSRHVNQFGLVKRSSRAGSSQSPSPLSQYQTTRGPSWLVATVTVLMGEEKPRQETTQGGGGRQTEIAQAALQQREARMFISETTSTSEPPQSYHPPGIYTTATAIGAKHKESNGHDIINLICEIVALADLATRCCREELSILSAFIKATCLYRSRASINHLDQLVHSGHDRCSWCGQLLLSKQISIER